MVTRVERRVKLGYEQFQESHVQGHLTVYDPDVIPMFTSLTAPMGALATSTATPVLPDMLSMENGIGGGGNACKINVKIHVKCGDGDY